MAAVFAGLVSGCNQLDEGFESKPDVSMTLTITVPETQTATRGLDDFQETFIPNIDVLVFDEATGTFRYHVNSTDVSNMADNRHFKVILKIGTERQRFVVFANMKDQVATAVGGFSNATTKAEALAAIQFPVTGVWSTHAPTIPIPMWGESEYAYVVTPSLGNIGAIQMLRSIARVDVGIKLGADDRPVNLADFTLTNVNVHRVANSAQGGPNSDTYTKTTPLKVTLPSMPTTVDRTLKLSYNIPEIFQALVGEIYIPENDNSSLKDDTRTCLVVGGRYKSGATSWYRIDFHNGTEFYDILRNHRYKVNITSVDGPGYPNEDEALTSAPMNITTSIVVWSEKEAGLAYDGQYFLSVSKDTLYAYSDGKCDFNIHTNHPSGWKIETTKSPTSIPNTNNGFSPKSGEAEKNVNVKFQYPTLVSGSGVIEFDIIAGNLKKKATIKIINEVRNGILNEFGLPEVLYFSHVGGNTNLTVKTDIPQAKIKERAGGPLDLRTSEQTPSTTKGKKVIVGGTKSSGTKTTQEGEVEVSVLAENANITSKTRIVQFTSALDAKLDETANESDAIAPNTLRKIAWNANLFRMQRLPLNNTNGGNDYNYVFEIAMLVNSTLPAPFAEAPYLTLPAPTEGYNLVFNTTGDYSNYSYADRVIAHIIPRPASKNFGTTGALGAAARDAVIDVAGHDSKAYQLSIIQERKPLPTFTFDQTKVNIPWDAKSAVVQINNSGLEKEEITKYWLQFPSDSKMFVGNQVEFFSTIRQGELNNAIPVFNLPINSYRNGTPGTPRTATSGSRAFGYGNTPIPVGVAPNAEVTISQDAPAYAVPRNLNIECNNNDVSANLEDLGSGEFGIRIRTPFSPLTLSPKTIVKISGLEKAGYMNAQSAAPNAPTANGITLSNMEGATLTPGKDNQETSLSFSIQQAQNESGATLTHSAHYELIPHNTSSAGTIEALTRLHVKVEQDLRPNGVLTVVEEVAKTVNYVKEVIPAGGKAYTFKIDYNVAGKGWIMTEYTNSSTASLTFSKIKGASGETMTITVPSVGDGNISRDINVTFMSEDARVRTILRLRQDNGTVLEAHPTKLPNITIAGVTYERYVSAGESASGYNYVNAETFCKEKVAKNNGSQKTTYGWKLPTYDDAIEMKNKLNSVAWPGAIAFGMSTNMRYWTSYSKIATEAYVLTGNVFLQTYNFAFPGTFAYPKDRTDNKRAKCVMYVPVIKELTK